MTEALAPVLADPWSRQRFPVAPRGTVGTETVPDAYLSPFSEGRLHPLQPSRMPRGWTQGAVYTADGALVPSSVRTGGVNGDHVLAADPDHVAVPSASERLDGHWLYGGHWMGHFGHFLTETLPTLWPDPPDDLAGVVFHRFRTGPQQRRWQAKLLRWAGYDVPVVVVTDAPVHVERLTVPTRPHVLNGYAHPEAAGVWDRIARAVGRGDDRRVFLSRTRFNERRRSNGRPVRSAAARDRLLDELFAERGFAIVSPERLTIDEQVRTAAGARVLAGASGSALHLSVFARRGSGVIEVADQRGGNRPLAEQRVLDTVCGHRSAVLGHDEDRDRMAELLDRLVTEPER